MPSARALAVIILANSSSEPARASPMTTAASLAERVTMPLIASSTLMVSPSSRPSLEDGETIKVEDAIKGIVTRSAKDAAVVIGEALAGSEEEFAKMMTAKARALGMTKTVYRNASGLPDDEQITTARDQAILGRAIQERFPTYYKYFQTRSFVFRGESISNHN